MQHATASLPPERRRSKSSSVMCSARLENALLIAEERGLLSGTRTLTLRGRMPSALVEEAKHKTGIQSDSKLLEAALANLVAADDYGAWLLAHKGTISKDIDLEF